MTNGQARMTALALCRAHRRGTVASDGPVLLGDDVGELRRIVAALVGLASAEAETISELTGMDVDELLDGSTRAAAKLDAYDDEEGDE
jgi:hypothetical protein